MITSPHVSSIAPAVIDCKHFFALFCKYLQCPRRNSNPQFMIKSHVFCQLNYRGRYAIIYFYLRLTLSLNAQADMPRISSWASWDRTNATAVKVPCLNHLAIAHWFLFSVVVQYLYALLCECCVCLLWIWRREISAFSTSAKQKGVKKISLRSDYLTPCK